MFLRIINKRESRSINPLNLKLVFLVIEISRLSKVKKIRLFQLFWTKFNVIKGLDISLDSDLPNRQL